MDRERAQIGDVLAYLTEITSRSAIYGGCDVFPADPQIVEIRDATYVPLNPALWFDHDPTWGIYKDGRLVIEAAYTRGPQADLVGQSPTIDPPPAQDAEEETYVYAGPAQSHFGHFLLASLNMLWHQERNWKFVIHGHLSPSEWFAIPFVADILGALGLTEHNFVRFEKPTRISRLIVPQPSFRELHSVHRVYAEMATRIGDRLLQGLEPTHGPPIYLSKQRLTSGVWRPINEDDLVNRLEKSGIEIVYPETLSISEQVNLFRSRLSIGTIGSFFHTIAICPEPLPASVLLREDSMPSNFVLIDGVKGLNNRYFAPNPSMEYLGADATFGERCMIPDPIEIAEAMLRTIDIK